MPPPSAPRLRMSAADRRDELVRAAVPAFAQGGLHGTAVSTITDAVGVTQPYAFSLFKTKKGLFLAAVEHGFDRVEETFRAAASTTDPEERLAAMGQAYVGLLEDRELLRLQLQAYAASGDDEVRTVVRRRYARLYELVRELSGAGGDALRRFFGDGMLLNVAAAVDLPLFADDDAWLSECDPEAGGAAAGGGSPSAPARS
ncbi:MAG TPA: TetR family transcriptional regulator [Solirubrobacteraceae bacterium]|nr:TetR family transcriptional regulator [Solirubrobacteraceae bacterium]